MLAAAASRPLTVLSECCGGLDGLLLALRRVEQDAVLLGYTERNKWCRLLHDRLHSNGFPPPYVCSDVVHRGGEPPPKVDVYLCSPPCQPFSTAGKRGGFDDVKDRAAPFLACVDYIACFKPTVFIIENVAALLAPCYTKNLDAVLGPLRLKYHIEAEILNAGHFGLPQHRERVFIVGVRHGALKAHKIAFPSPIRLLTAPCDFIDLKNTKKSKLNFNQRDVLAKTEQEQDAKGHAIQRSDRILDLSRYDTRVPAACPCITEFNADALYYPPRGRFLTFQELLRLQGIKDAECWPAACEGIPKTALFAMVGSSVAVDMAEALFRTLLPLIHFSSVSSSPQAPPPSAPTPAPLPSSKPTPKTKPAAPVVRAEPVDRTPPSRHLRPRGETCNLCSQLEPVSQLRTCRRCSARFHFRCPNSALGAQQRIVHDLCTLCDDRNGVFPVKCLLRSRQADGTFDYLVHFTEFDPSESENMFWVSEDGAVDLTGPEGLKRLPLLPKDACFACKAPFKYIELCRRQILRCRCLREYHVACELGVQAAKGTKHVKRGWRCSECLKVEARHKRRRVA